MKIRKYRRKKISRKVLERAQARLLHLSPEQVEHLERHRRYLELCWNSSVSPAEAFVDVLELNDAAFCAELNRKLYCSWRV